MNQKEKESLAMRVSGWSIVVNVGLSAFKLIAGIVAASGAMISDAIHSASDVFSTIIVIIGVRIAGKDADKEHPYGHERMECVAAILLAAVLAVTGFGIGISGLKIIFGKSMAALHAPGSLALWAAVVSIITKEGMYWVTRGAAKKINSGALMADAWHHRSDALSSVGSFVGILGARMGFPILDPVASVVICVFIVKAAVDIFKDSIDKMTDRACEPQMAEEIKTLALTQEGVISVDQLKTRLFGDKIYVEVEIGADATDSLQAAHDIAQQVHDAIEHHFPMVKHCMVHVNPAQIY